MPLTPTQINKLISIATKYPIINAGTGAVANLQKGAWVLSFVGSKSETLRHSEIVKDAQSETGYIRRSDIFVTSDYQLDFYIAYTHDVGHVTQMECEGMRLFLGSIDFLELALQEGAQVLAPLVPIRYTSEFSEQGGQLYRGILEFSLITKETIDLPVELAEKINLKLRSIE